MNIKKFLVGAAVGAVVFGLTTVAVLAANNQRNLMNQQWRIFNVKPDMASFWDINKVDSVDSELQFPILQYVGKGTGSFAVYFMNNYNVDITDTTLSASMNWSPGSYDTRSTTCGGAHVRFWFQDVASGGYTSNDYWWSSDNKDLNAETSGDLSVSLADANRSHWTNICGQSATDTTPKPGANCVGSIDPDISPYDGFTNAMKNVKQLGLSFGSDCRYASGVARVGGDGIFTVSSFDITSP